MRAHARATTGPAPLTLLATVAALLASWSLQPLAIRISARAGLVDIPNHRSSHSVPTPRSGGLAVVAGILLGTAISALAATSGETVGAYAATICGFALLGLLGDKQDLGAKPRLAAQCVLAAAGVLMLISIQRWSIDGLPTDLSVLLATLLIVAHVNAFNFMDGVNGISAFNAVVSGVYLAGLMALAGLDDLAVMALVVAAAGAGFVYWNVPRARAFLGDVGSYGIGASLALLVVIGIGSGVNWLLATVALFIYGVDTGATLLRRLARRQMLFVAHREHIYQRLEGLGLGHVGSALTCATASCVMCGWGYAIAWSSWSSIWVVPGMVMIGSSYLLLPRLVARWQPGLSRLRTPSAAAGLSP